MQDHLTNLEEISLELATLNNRVSAGSEIGLPFRSLLSSLGFIALMGEFQNMDYDLNCALLKYEMEWRKYYMKDKSMPKNPAEPTPRARLADDRPRRDPPVAKSDRKDLKC